MLSYARGADLPVLDKTIHQCIDEWARESPDSEALVSRHQKLRLTNAQLRDEVMRTARGLWGLGVRPGDRIGMWSASCAEWVYLQAALGRIGAILVNLNPAYRAYDLHFVLERARVKTLFLHEKDSRANYMEIVEEARRIDHLSLENVILLSDPAWDRMIERGVEPPEIATSADDVVNIQYTSGTTAQPKGVLLTHRNLVNNGWRMGRNMKIGTADRICTPVPLYHCFGAVIGVMVAITNGAALVLPAASFDALATLEAIHEERCTAIYGVPTMFIAELEHPRFREFDLTSLRTGVMAGSTCPKELMQRVATVMHVPELITVYGQTECSPGVTVPHADADFETRTSTVGPPLPSTEVKIVDPETGETVPIGATRELCSRGYQVMKGYDNNPAATAETIDAEGWLHSGDLATMREDGCCYITGRAKDMISRGGEKVYPREVEEFLTRHPKVSDAYVIGYPDERLGERVAAWVRLKDGASATAEEMRAFCREQIAYFKIPERIRFVDGFPATASGKIQKYIMREQETRAIEQEKMAEAAVV
jgi:fatty-acyl-CoA synthase